MTQSARRIRIGIDTGGTFTDVVAFDQDSGALMTTKTPSTPANPADGFINGLHKVLGLLGATGADVTAVCHGTTVATNQLLEGTIGQLGFITTEGYEFILEIARQAVPDGYGNSYFWVKPPRIVPADRVKTVAGRLDFEGRQVRPFDEQGATRAARWFRDEGIMTIGVCFLHSYANPEHERRMREILLREHPEAVVSISSDVLREYREYERSMTTLVDAAVKPLVSRYVANIASRLRQFTGPDLTGPDLTGPDLTGSDLTGSELAGSELSGSELAGSELAGSVPMARAQAQEQHQDGDRDQALQHQDRDRDQAQGSIPFYIMKSNGGVLSAAEVVHQPITTVLSGPAAGALGAALISARAGFDKVLTCDGGGTSTDVSVVLGGEPTLTTEGTVGDYPSKIPMIDVVTVGAGGGSIAWISREGTLKVGPRSAGADPGPRCYGRGGLEPTITDAHLLLGRIPAHLLGGEMPLDAEAARAGIEDIAGRLGLSPDACAAGILEISAWSQANALRQISVKRGLDVRDFMLATFGGSGSLLACRLVDILDLAGVVVPLNPGNVSAFGLLTVDVKNDYVQTAVCRHDHLEHASVEKALGELTGRAGEALDAEGFPRAEHRHVRTADLRYFGQAFEVRVDVPDGPVDADLVGAVATSFHDAHRTLYGYDFRDDPRQQVEWVNLRVTGIGPIRRPELTQIARAQDGTGDDRRNGMGDSTVDSAERARIGARAVCFEPAEGYVDAGVFWRPDLRAGDELSGPVIIEEFGATVPVHPGFTVLVDVYGNLVITRKRTGGGHSDQRDCAS
jgi:N-methylhydantoinase A